MSALKTISKMVITVLLVMHANLQGAAASEIDLHVPVLDVDYDIFGWATNGTQILSSGLIICVLGLLFGFYKPFHQIFLFC